MKKFVGAFAVLVLLVSCSKKSNKESEFFVRGNCEMCKERIEKTALAMPGVNSANWEVQSSNLKVAYDSTKVSEIEIHKSIAATGHGTKLVDMDLKAHAELPDCCQIEE